MSSLCAGGVGAVGELVSGSRGEREGLWIRGLCERKEGRDGGVMGDMEKGKGKGKGIGDRSSGSGIDCMLLMTFFYVWLSNELDCEM